MEDLKSYSPDMVIVDCELHAHIISALSLGVPVVLSNNMFLSPPSATAPPLGSRTVPGRGIRGSQLSVSFQWLRHFAKKRASRVRRTAIYGGADHPSALRNLSNALNIKLEKYMDANCWQYPWTYRLPTVLLQPKALDLPHEGKDGFAYLGPMIWKDRPIMDHNSTVVEKFCAGGPTTKKIYAAFGSMLTPNTKFIEDLWAAVSRHPEWELLCVTSAHWTHAPSIKPPRNVKLVEWAPQPTVLDAADVVLFHGGAGTLVEAAVAGTPMLVYPHVLDEFGNAARAVYHGVGVMADKTDSAQKIETDLIRILETPSFSQAAKELQKACLTGQAADTYQVLEKLVRENPV